MPTREDRGESCSLVGSVLLVCLHNGLGIITVLSEDSGIQER